jgi:hypothetical protein
VFKVKNKLRYTIGVGKQKIEAGTDEWDEDALEFLFGCQEKVAGWMNTTFQHQIDEPFSLNIRGLHTRNGVMFHGSPYFRDRYWRDWCMIDWGSQDGPEPAQIWCFVVLENLPEPKRNQLYSYGSCELTNGVYAVVECASYRTPANNEPRSLIFIPLAKEMRAVGAGGVKKRKFYLVDTDAIVDTCYVVPDITDQSTGTTNHYFQVKRRDEWIIAFEDWLALPNPEQYDDDKEGKNL